MKKKRGRTINIKINFSNRWLYFLITLGILAIVGVGVYAAQQASSGGTHSYAEIGLPLCSSGEVLKWSSGALTCGTLGSQWTCPSGLTPKMETTGYYVSDTYGSWSDSDYTLSDTCPGSDEHNEYTCASSDNFGSCRDIKWNKYDGVKEYKKRTVTCTTQYVTTGATPVCK